MSVPEAGEPFASAARMSTFETTSPVSTVEIAFPQNNSLSITWCPPRNRAPNLGRMWLQPVDLATRRKPIELQILPTCHCSKNPSFRHGSPRPPLILLSKLCRAIGHTICVTKRDKSSSKRCCRRRRTTSLTGSDLLFSFKR